MNFSCKELFDIFEKSGGKLICNYHQKKCNYYTLNEDLNRKECIFGKKDGGNIESLLLRFSDKYVTYLDSFQNAKPPDMIHSNQKLGAYGFIINYKNDA
jgi:hypothetical protein